MNVIAAAAAIVNMPSADAGSIADGVSMHSENIGSADSSVPITIRVNMYVSKSAAAIDTANVSVTAQNVVFLDAPAMRQSVIVSANLWTDSVTRHTIVVMKNTAENRAAGKYDLIVSSISAFVCSSIVLPVTTERPPSDKGASASIIPSICRPSVFMNAQ